MMSEINMETRPKYDIVLYQKTFEKIIAYKNDLTTKKIEPSVYLKEAIITKNIFIDKITNEQLIDCLVSTKKPLIFAETDAIGDGSDWNETELQILGDITIGMNVKIYDNGVWYPRDRTFHIHDPPLDGVLLFMPGPLLKCLLNRIPEDFKEITFDGPTTHLVDQNKYNEMINRRLTPLLYYANEKARMENVKALITIPGVGCCEFSGKFRGKMGRHLNNALHNILEKHGEYLDNVSCVRFDPFSECTRQEHRFSNLLYRVRPSVDDPYTPQLLHPKDYEEEGDDFSNCKLFKVVSWDHISYPGNDYFGGSRYTDDGVAAAATNSMEVITSIKGKYDQGYYLPPFGEENWEQVAKENKIKIRAQDNVKILTSDGQLVTCDKFEELYPQ